MSNDFLPFADDPGASVLSQADYAALPARTTGFQTGIAYKEQLNKVWRQSSVMAAMIGAFMDDQGQNAVDNGDQTALLNSFKTSFRSLVALSQRPGHLEIGIDPTVPPGGYVLANDGSIGNAASGASRANADTQALYTLLWNNLPDGSAPVVGGRGVSAAADFAAGKPITTGIIAGRAIAAAGAGSGLTPRAVGDHVGLEDQTLPVHYHTMFSPTPRSDSAPTPTSDDHVTVIRNHGDGDDYHISQAAAASGGVAGSENATLGQTAKTGFGNGTGIGENMQPTVFFYVFIKL